MTIAAGFRCKDGLILCADTQETIPGYSKTDTEKIAIFTTVEYSAFFVGCGDSSYIDTFVDQIKKGLTDNDPHGDADVAIELANCTRDFFSMCVAPWSSFPKEERPYVELLIGVQSKAATHLYHAFGTAFSEVRESMSIGAGVALAKSLTAQLFDVRMSISQAILVAIYILRQCKRWVDSCGGNTDIVVMTNNGQFTKIPSHEVSTLDSHFDRFQDSIKPILIAAADGTISHEAYEAAMKQFALEMFGLRGKFMGTDEFFDRFSKMIGIQIP